MKRLTIITRHMIKGREKSLERLLASMTLFCPHSFDHWLLIDSDCKGVSSANGLFEKNKKLIHGDYVYMMDDDDWFTYPTFPQDLLRFIEEENFPDIIMMRFSIVGRNLPQPWGDFALLRFCKVGTPNFCLRREVWLDHIKHFSGPSGGDFRMIESLQTADYSVAWWDKTVGTTRKNHGYGRTDEKSCHHNSCL